MADRLLLQLITLAMFLLLMGFNFCDYYKLPTVRKLIWFVLFLGISVSVLRVRREFDLALILPLPLMIALLLAMLHKPKKAA